MTCKGTADAWRQEAGSGSIWTATPFKLDGAGITREQNIIKCPSCTKEHDVKDKNLKALAGSSNLKCIECKKVASTSAWHCLCDVPWIKCSLHVHSKEFN